MDLTSYVDNLRHELAVAAEAGGDDVRALAERLTAPLDSAVRLVLLKPRHRRVHERQQAGPDDVLAEPLDRSAPAGLPERICLLSVCLIVNQLPWAPVRSCKCTAFHVLRESAPQVRRITNLKTIITY